MGLSPAASTLVLLLGLPVGVLLCAGLRPARSIVARTGTAALAGLGAIVSAVHMLMCLGVPPRFGLPAVTATGVVLAPLALVRARRRRLAEEGRRPAFEPDGATASLAVNVALLALVGLLLWVPFSEARELAVSEQDAIHIWAPKAQLVLDEAPPRFDAAPERSHPGYPRGFPLMMAAANLGGPLDPTIPRLVPLLLFVLTLLCAFDALSMQGNFAGAFAAVTILGSIPAVLHHATSGYADLPLAGFILLSGVGLSCGRGGTPAIFVALAGALGAAMTKDEGLAYGGVFTIVLAVTLVRQGSWRLAVLACGIAGVVAGPWAFLRLTAPVAGPVSLRASGANAGLLLQRLDQILLEGSHIALGTADPTPGGITLQDVVPGGDLVIQIAIACAVVLAFGRRGSFRVLPLGLLLIVEVVAILWSPQPVRWHLMTALSRLLLQCLPLLLVAAVDKLTSRSVPPDYPARTRT